MARNWRDIRADAVAQGRVDLQRAPWHARRCAMPSWRTAWPRSARR